jgi:hypothetical protein
MVLPDNIEHAGDAQRALEKQALRNVRGLVDKLEAEDRERSAGTRRLAVGLLLVVLVAGTVTILKGGAYLLYLANRLWRSKPGPTEQAPVAVSRMKAFRLGLLTNLSNPKAALFFGSVFATSFPAHPEPALQVIADDA